MWLVLRIQQRRNVVRIVIPVNLISKLINVFPKDIPPLERRSVLVKLNSEGSGRYKDSLGKIPKDGEDNE